MGRARRKTTRHREPSHRMLGVSDARAGCVEEADRRQARAAVKGSAALLAALVLAHGAPPPDVARAEGEAA